MIQRACWEEDDDEQDAAAAAAAADDDDDDDDDLSLPSHNFFTGQARSSRQGVVFCSLWKFFYRGDVVKCCYILPS